MHGERLLKGCLTAVVLSVSMLASLSAPAVAVGGAASAGGEPLAIVMDLSDSMNEDDGTGTVKLDGAKAVSYTHLTLPTSDLV